MSKRLSVLIAVAMSVGIAAAQSKLDDRCLVVRSGENHRVRNAAVFGLLSGGLGMGIALVASNTRYEREDSIGSVPFKTKYSGGELKKFAQEGIHIVVIGKNDSSPSTAVACGFTPSAPAPVTGVAAVVPIPTTATQQAQTGGEHTIEGYTISQGGATSMGSASDTMSLAEASRLAKAKKAAMEHQ